MLLHLNSSVIMSNDLWHLSYDSHLLITHTALLNYWWWPLNYHPMHPSWHTSFVHPDAPKQFLNDKQWTTNPLYLPLPPRPLCLHLYTPTLLTSPSTPTQLTSPSTPTLLTSPYSPTLLTSPSTPTLLTSQYTPTVYLYILTHSAYLSIHPHCLSPHTHPLCLPLSTPPLFSPYTPTLLTSQYTPTVLPIHTHSAYLSLHTYSSFQLTSPSTHIKFSTYLSLHNYSSFQLTSPSTPIQVFNLPLPPHLFKFSTYLSLHIAAPEQFVDDEQWAMHPLIPCHLSLLQLGIVHMVFSFVKALLQQPNPKGYVTKHCDQYNDTTIHIHRYWLKERMTFVPRGADWWNTGYPSLYIVMLTDRRHDSLLHTVMLSGGTQGIILHTVMLTRGTQDSILHTQWCWLEEHKTSFSTHSDADWRNAGHHSPHTAMLTGRTHDIFLHTVMLTGRTHIILHTVMLTGGTHDIILHTVMLTGRTHIILHTLWCWLEEHRTSFSTHSDADWKNTRHHSPHSDADRRNTGHHSPHTVTMIVGTQDTLLCTQWRWLMECRTLSQGTV